VLDDHSMYNVCIRCNEFYFLKYSKHKNFVSTRVQISKRILTLVYLSSFLFCIVKLRIGDNSLIQCLSALTLSSTIAINLRKF